MIKMLLQISGSGKRKYVSLGCWRDTGNLAIPSLEGTDPRVDGNYRWRRYSTEKCYQVALSRGFTVFAIQHSGWCLGSADAQNTYQKYGPSTGCASNGEGGLWASEVYQITDELAHWLNISNNWLKDYGIRPSRSHPTAALDCSTDTYWLAGDLDRQEHESHWMVLDMQTPHTIFQVSITSEGSTRNDVGSFILEASTVDDPYAWAIVRESDSVTTGTSEPQPFGGSEGTGRFWKITFATATGWQPTVVDVCFFGHKACATGDCDFTGNQQNVSDETATGQPCHVSVDIHEGVRSIGNPLQVRRSGNVTLHSIVTYECQSAFQVTSLWSVNLVGGQAYRYLYPDSLHLHIPAGTMPLGVLLVQLRVTMNVTEISHVSVGTAQTYVEFLPLPLVASLGNAERTVGPADEFWVNAVGNSWDPEGLLLSSDFSYSWTCEVVYLPRPKPYICFEVRNNILIYNGTRYKVFTEAKTATDAAYECAKEAGYLASPNDEEEWTAISLLNDCVDGDKDRTIGIMDVDGDGQWSLSDGDTVTWSDWAPGYPSSPTADACVKVTPNGWSDATPGYYTIRLESYWWPDDTRIAAWRFRVLPDPVPMAIRYNSSLEIPPDTCTAVPLTEAFKFCIKCKEFYDVNGPVQMEIKYEFIPEEVEMATVKFPGDDAPTDIFVILVVYSGWVGYSPVIEIPPGYVAITPRVFSTDGRSTTLRLPPVQIRPPTFEQLEEVIEGLYNKDNGLLFIHQQQGATEQAFMDSVIPPKALASLADRGADITKLVDVTIEAMAEVEADVDDYVEVQAASTLKALTETVRELATAEPVNGTRMLPLDHLNRAAGTVITGVAHLLKASEEMSFSERQGGNSFSANLAANKASTTIAFQALDTLGDIILNVSMSESPDEDVFADYNTSNFFEANFNPFEYSNNSDGIQSDVVGLHVRCGDEIIPVSNLAEPIDILARRRGFSVDVNSVSSSVSWQPVTLFLNKHSPPTSDEHGWSGSLPVPDDQLFTLITGVNGTNMTSNPYQWLLPQEVIDITEDDVERFTKFYIGVQFGTDLDLGNGDLVNFTLQVFETTCVYFAENNTHLWQSDGCKVGLISSPTHIHCRCDHLTKFAGLVAPNPLNIPELLTGAGGSLLVINENPVGLALVLAVFASYLFGLLCVRKADRKDLTKVGLWLLPGHRLNPRKDCQYVVTVYTGLRGNAGTTADVSISLWGFTECSQPIVLRDPKRFLFERGSVDSFLVSTEQPIGTVTHLRVWHNNAGYSPAWDMSDDHLWFSVALRPARSPFTRVQRLSCCLTLLYSTMITNIMFFGRGDDFDPPEPIRIAGVEISPPISLPELMIGIQSALIILPINLLVALFFRYSGTSTPTASGSKNGTAVRENQHVVAHDMQPSEMTGISHKSRTDENQQASSKKKFSLPWWGAYLGWLLVWSASFVASFFTILYSLSFGRAKAEAWAVTFVTSFFTDILLLQPVKLVLVAIVFALLFRKPVEDDGPPPSPVSDDEEYLHNDNEDRDSRSLWNSVSGWMTYMGKNRASQYTSGSESSGDERSTSPPDESVLAELRAKSAEKRKRRAAVLEVIVFSLFVTVIMLTAYGERSPLAFQMTQNVKEHIMGGENDIPDITDIPSFWEWVEGNLIPATHSEEWYNGETSVDDSVLPDMLTHQLGTIQLRQVRLPPGQLCQTAEKLQTLLPRCTTGFSNLNADTADYIEGWVPHNDTFNYTDPVVCPPNGECLLGNTTWKYTFASLSDSFPYFLKHGTYLSGGYATTLGRTQGGSVAMATFLQQHNWLDERTRAVFVELILYNPHANLFSVVTIVVEFTQLGAAFTTGDIVSLRLIQHDAILLLALRVLMAIFLVFFAVKQVKNVLARPIQYLSEFWSWVELLVVVVGFSTLGVYFKAQFIIDETADQRTSPVFELYKSAVNWYGVYTYLLGFVICCVTLKFIRLLRFNSHVLSLSMTLKNSFKPVIQFCVIAGIVLMGFTQMANLLFGTKLQGYEDILSSLAGLCTMMLGAFDFDAIVEGHRMLGPLMFFSYQVMMQFILLSMFMTIVMDVYAEESQDPNTDDLRPVRTAGGPRAEPSGCEGVQGRGACQECPLFGLIS
ncbi:PKD1L3 [Branchiostoma lanceolatum]|uniref:PKD1L3 protein n=1 Tax=Branchiostoma lanceolatum TaxID=7740 RepID=A0A8J9VYD7_BRALA|nr:PKD1L3 [Branchiostoma lanceolatum]